MKTPPVQGLVALRRGARGRARANDGTRASTPSPRSSSRTAPCRRSASASGRCSSRETRSSCRRRASSSAGRSGPPAAIPVYVPGTAADGWRWDAKRSSRRSASERRRCCSATPATRPATCPCREDVAAAVALAETPRARRSSPTRRTRRRSGTAATLASAFGLGEDVIVIRSLGKSLSLPQLRIGLLAGPAARVEACTRTLEWDCLRVGVASQEAALAALDRPARLARADPRRASAATATSRSRRVAATPGLDGRDAARGSVPLRRHRDGRMGSRASSRPSGFRSSTARRSRRPATPGFRSAAPPQASALLAAALGRWAASCTLDEIARHPPPHGRPDRGQQPLAPRCRASSSSCSRGCCSPGAIRRRTAALAAGLVYAPLLLTAIPAGASSDNIDPRRLMRTATVVMLAACSLYPLAALAGHDWFVLVLVAAVVVGLGAQLLGGRPLPRHRRYDTAAARSFAPTPCARPSTRRPCSAAPSSASSCSASAARLPSSSASAPCSSPRSSSSPSCPELERESEPIAVMRENVAVGIASLRRQQPAAHDRLGEPDLEHLRRAAFGIMPAVLREHLGMNEVMAERHVHRRCDRRRPARRSPSFARPSAASAPISTFLVAIIVQSVAVLLFANDGVAVVAPMVYCLFLLSNSAAAASLNGARAAEVGARPPGAPQHGAAHARDDRVHDRASCSAPP